MNSLKFLVVAAALIAAPVVAQSGSSAATSVKKGDMVFSVDGRRIGRIDFIRDDEAGIIYNGRFIKIPVSTLSNSDKGVATTLTYKEVGRL